MYLDLKHQSLKATQFARSIVNEIYKATALFPDHEKFSMVNQARRAAVSVYLNICEGCSRRSEAERKRFFEIARGSLIEVDAILDIADDLAYTSECSEDQLKENMVACFKILTRLMNL